MTYNIIQHEIRNKAGLSMLDYCLLESIYNLSTSGREKYKTWCNASKSNFKYLASTRTIITRFKSLEEKGWLEFKDEKRFLKRTTKKYYNEVYAYIKGVKKLHHEETAPVKKLHLNGEEVSPKVVKKLHSKGEETAPNKDIKYSDNNNDKESKAHTQEISELKEKLKNVESENLILKSKEQITPPPTAEQLNAKNEETPQYKITLHDYPYSNWTDQLKTNFLTYCQMRHEKAKDKGFSYGFTQTKENVSEVENMIFQYSTDIAQAAVKMATKGGWIQFFPERIKNDIERERVKQQQDEQKQAANNEKSIYSIFDDQPINNGNQDGHESDNSTVDVEFTEG